MVCDSYLKRRKKSKPKKITLDVDSTHDPTHGQQELSFYHGFYREHIYHPLLIFDADTGDLITALLRPGNRGAASGVVSVLKRLMKKMRRRLGKKLDIEIRADSGFATPAVYDFCESEKLSYVIGFARNARVQAGIEAFVEKVMADFQRTQEAQRQFTELLYQADSWEHPPADDCQGGSDGSRFESAFCGHQPRGSLGPRSVRTLCGSRAGRELRKSLQKGFGHGPAQLPPLPGQPVPAVASCFSLSVDRAAARLSARHPLANLEVETLRRRLFKIGARVQESSRRIWIHFASSYPLAGAVLGSDIATVSHLSWAPASPSGLNNIGVEVSQKSTRFSPDTSLSSSQPAIQTQSQR